MSLLFEGLLASRKTATPPHTDTICPGSGKLSPSGGVCSECGQAVGGWEAPNPSDGMIRKWHSDPRGKTGSRKVAGWVTDPGYNDSSVGGDQIFDQGSSRGCVWNSIEGDWGWSIGGPINEDGEWEDEAEDSVSGTADDEASAKRQVEQYLSKGASRKVADNYESPDPSHRVCMDCLNDIEYREDPTGQRGVAWADDDGFGDDRDFQCGIADDYVHHPYPLNDPPYQSEFGAQSSRHCADVQPPCTACGMPCAPGDIYCADCGSANDRSAWTDSELDNIIDGYWAGEQRDDDAQYFDGTGGVELAENHYGSSGEYNVSHFATSQAVDYLHTLSNQVQWRVASDEPSVSEFETPKDQTASPTGGNVGEGVKDYPTYLDTYLPGEQQGEGYNPITPPTFENQETIGVS